MKWTIDWGPVFQRDLRAIPSVHVAARLCQAIMVFAETGQGPVTQVHADNPRWLEIRVEGAVAYMFADERARTLYMSSAYPRSA